MRPVGSSGTIDLKSLPWQDLCVFLLDILFPCYRDSDLSVMMYYGRIMNEHSVKYFSDLLTTSLPARRRERKKEGKKKKGKKKERNRTI